MEDNMSEFDKDGGAGYCVGGELESQNVNKKTG